MRGAMWMALALMGTSPLMALAQQQGMVTQPQQTVASPTGAASVTQGQDSVGSTGAFGVFGGPGLDSVPLRSAAPASEWWLSGTGGSGMMAPSGPTYRGTTPEIPSPQPSSTASSSVTSNKPDTQARGEGNLAELQQRVDALEREVSSLRGTGGSGAAATTAAPAANTAPNANASRDEDTAPVAVVSVEFDGTVRDVTSEHIDVVDSTDGTLSRLAIDGQTRAFKGSPRKQIPLKELTEGTRVQTSFDYISGVEHARDIVVRPSSRGSQR
ncbi:MAG: hypothetical protein ABW123_03465 [Cystobacter sp.]